MLLRLLPNAPSIQEAIRIQECRWLAREYGYAVWIFFGSGGVC